MTQEYRFPPPPPPSNADTLSTREKKQLRRSTVKLTKVLGAPPQIVDSYTGPIHISLPISRSSSTSHNRAEAPEKPRTLRREKSKGKGHGRSRTLGERYHPDSYPLSSCSAPRPPASLKSSISRAPSLDSGYQSSDTSTSCIATPAVVPAPRAAHRIPRVPVPTLHMDEITSPTAMEEVEKKPSQEGQQNRDSVCDSLYDPPFTITSEHALRCAKMARVAKRLGDGVPTTLVFNPSHPPSSSEPSPSSSSICSTGPCPAPPPTRVRSRSLSRATPRSETPTPFIHESDGMHGHVRGRREFARPIAQAFRRASSVVRGERA